MAANAQTRGWGSPDEPGYREKYIVRTKIAGVTWLVHRKYEPILRELLERYAVPTIGPITKVADDWSYVNRDIRGRPGVKSNHSWGLAVDVNATQNPMGGGRHGQFPADFGKRIAHLGVKWGGDYMSRTDPMHFEFVGTPAEADRIAAQIESRTEPEDDMPLTEAEITKIAGEVALILKPQFAIVNRNIGTVAGNQGASDKDAAHGSIGDVLRGLAAVQEAVQSMEQRLGGGSSTTPPSGGGDASGTYTVTFNRTE